MSNSIINQEHHTYTQEDHAIWRELCIRQTDILTNRACKEFLDGISTLNIIDDGIPDFEKVSAFLESHTGWRIVAVHGIIPDQEFFTLLSERKFPVTRWIRTRNQMDYLQQPDIFHDLFGHVPMLTNKIFADFMAAYGHGGLKAMKSDSLHMLTRLYWFTVEFGLINTKDGLRIYGAGIVSSKTESVYSLESYHPNRLVFDLDRIMRSKYIIDDVQKTYFVIDSFDALMKSTETDFLPIYKNARTLPEIEPGQLASQDKEYIK